MTNDIEQLTIAEAGKLLEAKEISSVDLVRACLKNIEKRNPLLNAYLEVFDDAETQAQAADERRSAGENHPLLGIPLAIKDNILIEGRKASAASKILENYTATYDATVIGKLKDAGAVFLGRTNMDEFAMGGSTENSAFGVTKNPVDETRVPGGSSGGSAAAVAGNMAFGSLGSDTGGSIREPASFCGIVGLKPTYGSVSRSGLMALGSSLDVIGPFARSVEDAKIIFDAIKGKDPLDSTSADLDAARSHLNSNHSSQGDIFPRRVGVPRHLFKEGVDADVMEVFEKNLEKLQAQGMEIVDIELPSAPLALAMYYIIMPAEASTNLARFDGVRYGLSLKGNTIWEDYAVTRGKGFGPEVRRRVMLGTYVLSAGYYDAYYGKATVARAKLTNEFAEAFTKVDIIATPTAPTPAFKIGEKSDPLSMYLADIFTVPANLAGVPAISVPAGAVTREGTELPAGIQFMATHSAEVLLFAAGRVVENSQI